MKTVSRRAVAAFLLLVAGVSAGCASAPPSGVHATPSSGAAAAPPSGLHATPPTLGRLPYADADVDFMAGMIPHHAQAVIMAGWAPTHGARPDVAILCERIVVGQRDEIKLMQTWLDDRGLPVPDASSTRMHMKMPGGMEHDMLMPGMLSDDEMAALDRARGPDFDRLFLEGMIRHHQGAIDMVDVLLKAYGAAQDEVVFKFANDVQADQSVEIDVMKHMLDEREF
jgi:uncharacterized protein (DUF305 family)